MDDAPQLFGLARRTVSTPEADDWLSAMFNDRQRALLDGMGVLRILFNGTTFEAAEEGVRSLIFPVDADGEIALAADDITDILAIDPAADRAALFVDLFDMAGQITDRETLVLYQHPMAWLRAYFSAVADWLDRIKDARKIAPSEPGPPHPLFGEQGQLVINAARLRLNVASPWLWGVREIICPDSPEFARWLDKKMRQQSCVVFPKVLAPRPERLAA